MNHLLNIILLSIFSYLEMTFDKKTSKVIDQDGRTEEENSIIHEWFIYIRGFVLVLTSFNVAAHFDMVWWKGIVLLAYSMPLYGNIFNVMCAKLWLKGKKWHYDRTGNGLRNFILKAVLVAAGIAVIELV